VIVEIPRDRILGIPFPCYRVAGYTKDAEFGDITGLLEKILDRLVQEG
jgi:hypothetical protein